MNQQEREQQARAWLKENMLLEHCVVTTLDGEGLAQVSETLSVLSRVRIQSLTALLAATERAVWEEAAKYVLQYNCDHNHGEKATKACDDIEQWLRQRAKQVEG